jgi:deoxyribonuclease-1
MLRPAGAILLLALLPVALRGGTATAPHRDGERIADYFTALALFWDRLYAGGGETLYCAHAFGPRRGRGVNVEHVFPMSWVTRHLGCGRRQACRRESARFNRIEADLHNLWPARTAVNQARSSHAFAEIPGERRRFPGCDFEVDEARRRVEPRPAVRGEIARSVFYMAEEHGLVVFPRHGRLLQRWHREDPVSAEERRRNDVIEGIQGNRNPFIDDPGRAERLRFSSAAVVDAVGRHPPARRRPCA